MNVKIVNAKVNLSLAIVGKKQCLHMLDMIFYPIEDIYDIAKFTKDDSNVLKIEKIETDLLDFDEERFISFLNAKLILINNYFKIGGKLELVKNVPLGAGIGGSSTMIAAIVKTLEDETSIKASKELLLDLGSDVPYMMIGGAARVKGLGDIVEPLQCDKLIFNVKFVDGGVDTKACYKMFDDMDLYVDDLPPKTIDEALIKLRNDLFIPACSLNPRIKEEYDNLVKEGYKVVMTGSGSSLVYFK